MESSYTVGETNQGKTIGQASLPLKDIYADTIIANSFKLSNGSSISIPPDNTTIILNSEGDLSVNPSLSIDSLTLSGTIIANSFKLSNGSSIYIPPDNTTIILNSEGDLSVNPSLSIDSLTLSDTLSVTGDTTASNITTSGWIYQQGRNRVYYQKLESSSTNLIGSPPPVGSQVLKSLEIIPKFSGHIIIDAQTLISNTVSGDATFTTLWTGSTSGAQTTCLIFNSPMIISYADEYVSSPLHYELTDQPIGTPIYISLGYGGTESNTGDAEIIVVSFIVEEI
jgi:hypothetical protein